MMTLKFLTPLLLRFGILSAQTQQVETDTAKPNTNTATQTEELQFLAAIAQLPPYERQHRLRKRNAYRQLVERQGVIEAEHQANRNHQP